MAKKQPKKDLALPGVEPAKPTMSEITARKQAKRLDLPIVLDNLLAERLRKAEKDHGTAELRLMGKPKDPERIEELEAAQIAMEEAAAAAEDSTFVFEIQAIARPEMEDLIAAMPPTPKQIADYRAKMKANSLPMNEPLGYDIDLFPPDLMARCIITPSTTVEEMAGIWNGTDIEAAAVWSQGEMQMLFSACLSVNQAVA